MLVQNYLLTSNFGAVIYGRNEKRPVQYGRTGKRAKKKFVCYYKFRVLPACGLLVGSAACAYSALTGGDGTRRREKGIMSKRMINVSGVALKTKAQKKKEARAMAAVQASTELLSDEVLTADALKKFPDLGGLGDRDMLVMMAVAHGFAYRAVAKAMGISASTVMNVVRRIDPCSHYRLDEDGMKAFVAKRARAKTAEALSLISMETMKDECSQVQIVKIAKTTAEIGAIQERKDVNTFGDKKIKKITVEFVDEIDEARPVFEIVEEEAY